VGLCRVLTRGAGVVFAKEPTPLAAFRLGLDLRAAGGPTWWRVAIFHAGRVALSCWPC
jgi:hypothetical protein